MTMLPLLDDVLRRLLLRDEARGLRGQDVTFDQPTREWSARLGGPAINLFLFDLRENTRLRNTGEHWGRLDDGNGEFASEQRRAARFDARYMLTVWAKSPEDERELMEMALLKLWLVPALTEDLLKELYKLRNEEESERGQAKPERKLLNAPRQIVKAGDSGRAATGENSDKAKPKLYEDAYYEFMSQPVPITIQVAQSDVLEKPTDVWSVLSNDMRPAIPVTVTFALQPFDKVETRAVKDMRWSVGNKLRPADFDRLWQISGMLRPERKRPFDQPRLRLVQVIWPPESQTTDIRRQPAKLNEVVPLDVVMEAKPNGQKEFRCYRLRHKGLPAGTYTLEMTARDLSAPVTWDMVVPSDSYDADIPEPEPQPV